MMFRDGRRVTQLVVTFVIPIAVLSATHDSATRAATPTAISPADTLEDAFDLSGRVVDERTGRPVARVIITVDTTALPGPGIRSTRTDADGRYRFTRLPIGDYFVGARGIGYYVERREVEVTCPVVVVEPHETVVRKEAACAPPPEVVNFSLRVRVVI